MTGEECTLMARAFGTVKPEVLEIEIGQTSHDGSHCESDDTEWDGTSSAGNSSSKTVNARRTQERSKLIDVEHKEGGRRTFPCRMEEGHPKPHYDFHMHSSGIMLKEHGLKGIPSSRQAEHMVSLPSGTTTSRFTSQETTLERGKHVPLSSYIPHQSQRMPQCRPASTRPQAHFKQSQEEPASLPVPATCQASEDNTELLKELNTRVQRLEDYHQRTNELLQQVVSILQTQSNVLQRSVN
ncbi:uncharacterized protein [Pleurodeles waltl]|uniref:uncharacterized protein isoform X4 n=1 Tax=Pleurodeles waltl TaxID=8319 RepID=UPI00370957E3